MTLNSSFRKIPKANFTAPIVLAAVAIFTLSSCTTTMEYSISHVDEPVVTATGLRYNSRTENDVVYSVAPVDIHSDGPEFHVVIENKGNNEVTVDSQIFALTAGSESIRATDPETSVEALAQEIERIRLLEYPEDRATVPVKKVETFSEETKKRQQKMEEEQRRIAAEIKALTSERDRIISRFLKRTTLESGEAVNGLIQFRLKEGWKKPDAVMLLKINSINEAANTIPFVVEYN